MASAWRVKGRWTAAGREQQVEFVVVADVTGQYEEANRAALRALVGLVPPEAGKAILDVEELELVGKVLG